MSKITIMKIAPFILATGITIVGCGEKSDCEIPSRHVHKYVKVIDEDITISKYLNDERLNKSDYQWTDDHIVITKEDEKFYKLVEKEKLFEGASNWEYLYNKMVSNHNYLEFYYQYTTTETYVTVGYKGRATVRVRPVVRRGWHTDPNSSRNTGEVRLCHHRYIGYKIINENGKLKLEKSPEVDDIREIINEYPYFKEGCTTIVTSDTYEFNKSELSKLLPEDFNIYEGPDLDNKELTVEKSKTKTVKF